MHLTTDYSTKILHLNPDYEGEAIAVLIASNHNQGNRESVLYIHGYIDYFFQAHLGKAFNNHGIDFYALDLRKHGRALLPHQHPNYCKSLTEYYEEISMALREISCNSRAVYLMGHSTGGLLASNYMNEGAARNLVSKVFLNAPFLDFIQSKLTQSVSLVAAKAMAGLSDYAKLDGMITPAYVESIHKDFHGEWDFNLDWKPVHGFPTYFKWIVAIAKAQQKLEHSAIPVPVLLLHSSGSKKLNRYTEEAKNHDIILDVEDMKRIGPSLGKNVTLVQIDHAMHDVFLSAQPVRKKAFEELFNWLGAGAK